MIRSMTGYGLGAAEDDGLRVVAELRTVNSRFTDLKLRIPPDFASWESEIRGRIMARVRRGRVELDLRFEGTRAVPSLVLNRPLAAAVRAAADALRKEFGAGGSLEAGSFLQVPGMLQPAPRAATVSDLERSLAGAALDRALSALDAERLREGEALRSDVLGRIGRMASAAETVRDRSAGLPERARLRLIERIRSLAAGVEPDPARLAQEIAMLADRSDVTEELVRLGGHLEQLRRLVEAPDGEPVGKRLDFLLQEVNREVNTVASKTQELEISRAVLDLKSEAEKVREQIQNLE